VRALLALTEGGPVLALTNAPGSGESAVAEVLRRRDFAKFIAYELPVEQVRSSYGVAFEVIVAELQRARGARVLDYDGSRIFRNLSLSLLGSAFVHEA
jgi:hypothetical protein